MTDRLNSLSLVFIIFKRFLLVMCAIFIFSILKRFLDFFKFSVAHLRKHRIRINFDNLNLTTLTTGHS